MKFVNHCWKCGDRTENPVGWNYVVYCDICIASEGKITVSNTTPTIKLKQSAVSSTNTKNLSQEDL